MAQLREMKSCDYKHCSRKGGIDDVLDMADNVTQNNTNVKGDGE